MNYYIMIHLIFLNTSSGKMAYTKVLKGKTNEIIFSIDKWNRILFLADKKPTDGLKLFLERKKRSESLMMDLIMQLEESQTKVIPISVFQSLST
jgi:hypothetical protein